MDAADVAEVTRIIRQVAQEQILPRFGSLKRGEISEKKPGDIVTVADVEAELQLSRCLTTFLPDSSCVGEEASEADPLVFRALGYDAPVWILDPLDGTRNFANKRPHFAVIVALNQDGATQAAWIHDPLADETIIALRGQGAWLGTQRLTVTAPANVADMTGCVSYYARKRLTTAREQGRTDIPERLVRLGSVGREYMELTRGRMDFALYGGRIKPWDHAAGVLIYTEAGGYAAHLDTERAYAPSDGIVQTRLLLAPNREAWAEIDAMITATRGIQTKETS